MKLIFPAGISLKLWRRLIYAGAHPIGLREYNSICHEKGKFVYPDDFPLTSPYSEMQCVKGFELAITHYRKPPAKRLNYQKVGFPYPFISLWEDLVPSTHDASKMTICPFSSGPGLGLCPVEIKMLKRYVPKDRAILCVAFAASSVSFVS